MNDAELSLGIGLLTVCILMIIIGMHREWW